MKIDMTHLEAIEEYVEIINVTLPEGIDGEGPIRQALGEIVAEATALDSERDAEVDRGNRLAMGYVALAEYTYGPKRFNAFPLVMKYHAQTQHDDFANVRDAIDAEIAELDDWRDPDEGEEAQP